MRWLASANPLAPPVLNKYRDKLVRKAREEGVEGIDDLRAAYADRIRDVRKRDAMPDVPEEVRRILDDDGVDAGAADGAAGGGEVGGETQGRKEGEAASRIGIRPLSSVLDLEKLQELPADAITEVWRLHNAENVNALCATVPEETYAHMVATARRYPQFLLPLPHPEQGAELHFLQWTFDDEGGASTGTSTVLFTSLAEYKARGEFATPHTTVTHHTDLVRRGKGLVLMDGALVEGRGGVKIEGARWLVMCLQRFYGAGIGVRKGDGAAERRGMLLEWFARGDARFTVEGLLEETERLA